MPDKAVWEKKKWLCDSTKDPYVLKTDGLFLEEPLSLLSLEMLDTQPFLHPIWHESTLQVHCVGVFLPRLNNTTQQVLEGDEKHIFCEQKHNLISC